MNKIKVTNCSERHNELIFEYLEKQGKLSAFNHPVWIEILFQSYRTKKVYFIAYNDGVICGVLSGYIVTSLKLKKGLHTLKEGLVADSDLIYSRILDYVNDFCKNNRIESFLVSTGRYELSDSSYKVTTKKSLKIKILKSVDKCWDALRSKERTQIRKVLKQGFHVEKDRNNLKYFYNIYVNSMIKKKVSIHSFNFFETMFEKFGDCAELITLRKDDNIVAGIVLIYVDGSVYHPFHTSNANFYKYKLNNLLIWESVKYCVEKGASWLHMGEATLNGGVYKFKVSVGGEPFDSFYYTNMGKSDNNESYNNSKSSLGSYPLRRFQDNIVNFLPKFLSKSLFIFLRKRTKML